MARRVQALTLLGLALIVGVALAASESLRNDSGQTASGIVVRFSESVRITSWDTATFSTCSPTSDRAELFTFSGGELAAGSRFRVSWSPSDAAVTSVEWLATAAATSETSMGFEKTSDTPAVTGDLLNAAYFAHAAYVMQGVSDRGKIFTMPLLGIAELAFSPTMAGIDPATVTWSAQISHPDGIGAEISDGMLYIWGNSLSWAGYGEVVLTGATSDGHAGSAEVPVVVFRTDRTLTDAAGKKADFVPWSPQLDINRIVSVEEHMRAYGKGEGSLDRRVSFGRWKPIEPVHDVDAADTWWNELQTDGRWPKSTQFALVDVILDDLCYLGVDAIRVLNPFYVSGWSDTDIFALYDVNLFGLTKRPDEEAYVVNEAHRRGMSVTVGNSIAIWSGSEWAELYESSPSSLTRFISSLRDLNGASLSNWAKWGADVVDVCPAVSSLNQYKNTMAQANELNAGIVSLADAARQAYPGPLFHGAHYSAEFYPGTTILEAPFWGSFDIIGLSGWGIDLTGQGWGMNLPGQREATVPELVAGWQKLISRYFVPFRTRWSRPFVLWENGALAVEGCANYGLVCSRIPGYDNSKVSLDAMADYYEAQDLAFADMQGYYAPGWYMHLFHPYVRGGVRDTVTPTFRLKIEDLIQQICQGAVHERVIRIDGAGDDWTEVSYVVGIDPAGDARGVNDTISVSFTQDGAYLYFGIRYTAPPSTRGHMQLRLDADGDGVKDVEVLMSNIWSHIADWACEIYQRGKGAGPMIGFADAIDAGSMIEMRIAKRFLSDYLDGPSLAFQVANFDHNWGLQDETTWITLGPTGADSAVTAVSVRLPEAEAREEAELLRVATTAHAPIEVLSNDDFLAPESGVTAGSGVPDDPFVIEGWRIATEEGVALRVEGTTAHFVISQCSLSGGQNGLLLVDVENGQVSSCVIDGGDTEAPEGICTPHAVCGDAVAILGCHRIRFEDNTILDAAVSGLSLHGSSECLIGENTVCDCMYEGISLGRGSRDNTVVANHLAGNAIHVGSPQLTIDSANCCGNKFRGNSIAEDPAFDERELESTECRDQVSLPLSSIGWQVSFMDERADPEKNWARITGGTDGYDSYRGMAWVSPWSVDLDLAFTCPEQLECRSLHLTLAADAPVEVIVWVEVSDEYYGRHFRAAVVPLLVGAAPQVFSIPYTALADEPVERSRGPRPLDSLNTIVGVALLPAATAGELRVYDVSLRHDLSASATNAHAEAPSPLLQIEGLEYLGNPLAERFPDGSGLEASRRVWDMQAFGDKVYFGHGNAISNSGATPVWYWDCVSEAFSYDFTVDDEEIRYFRVVGDELLVAGYDATELWDYGNMYVFDGSSWTKRRTLPNALHCWSVWRFDGDFFAAVSGEERVRRVLRSEDDGLTWAEVPVQADPMDATRQFFEVGGRLYLSYVVGSGVLVWDGQQFAELQGVSFFPGSPITIRKGNEFGWGMHMFEAFGDALVYIGQHPGPWLPLGYIPDAYSQLYVMRDVSSNDVEAIALGGASELIIAEGERGSPEEGGVKVLGEETYDVVVADEACWVLTNVMHADDIAATVRVYRSTDLDIWSEVLVFESPTAATSFEVCGGAIYLSLGPAHPHTVFEDSIGEAHPAAGRVYRYALP